MPNVYQSLAEFSEENETQPKRSEYSLSNRTPGSLEPTLSSATTEVHHNGALHVKIAQVLNFENCPKECNEIIICYDNHIHTTSINIAHCVTVLRNLCLNSSNVTTYYIGHTNIANNAS